MGDCAMNPFRVYLMLCHDKSIIFTHVMNTATLYDVKQIVLGIHSCTPDRQRLFWNKQNSGEWKRMEDDNKMLCDYIGHDVFKATPQNPITVGLAFQTQDDEWESLHVEPVSPAGELPMKMETDSE